MSLKREKLRKKREEQFSEKIDELNQETDNLMDEIEKWEMNSLNLMVKNFISCENGQEEHLEELSIYLNKKFNNLKNHLGNIGENKLLLISSITIMDEYFETKKKLIQKKDKINRKI